VTIGVVVIAVISDTHLPQAGRELPEACLQRMSEADLILHAGDISTVAALEELRSLGPPVRAIHGDVEEPALRRRLPAQLELRLGAVGIAVTHDAGPARGRLARMRRRFPGAEAVIFGHSHQPLHETADDGFQIFNPGSPSQRRRAPHHTMGLARVVGNSVSFAHLVL
jgi:uncharacterized protein